MKNTFEIDGQFVRIHLTKGYIATIDLKHLELAQSIKGYWCAQARPDSCIYAYNVRQVNGKSVATYLHRLLLGLQPGDKGIVDHLDHDPMNCIESNMRIGDHQTNQHNRRGKGYHLDSITKLYRAQIRVNYKRIALGSYKTAAEARHAYLDAKRTLHPTSPIPAQEFQRGRPKEVEQPTSLHVTVEQKHVAQLDQFATTLFITRSAAVRYVFDQSAFFISGSALASGSVFASGSVTP